MLRSRLFAALVLALGVTVAPVAAAPAVAAGVGTITIDDPVVAETAGTATFKVYLMSAIAAPVTVTYQSFDDSAHAGSDYVAVSGTLTFPASASSVQVASIVVPLVDDALFENYEVFRVNLTGSSIGSQILRGDGHGWIIDDLDAGQIVSINDPAPQREGDGPLVFTVSRNTSAGQLTVGWTTVNGYSGAADFIAASGIVTFPPGSTSQTISITVLDDAVYEPLEDFFINLSSFGGFILDANGWGHLVDDDAPPTIDLQPGVTAVSEGANGVTTVRTLTVSRTAPSGVNLQVDVVPSDISAMQGVDWDFVTPGPFTIPAGPAGASVDVGIRIYGDDQVEGDEVFELRLANPVDAVIGGASSAAVTISNDDLAALPPSTGSDRAARSTLPATGADPAPIFAAGAAALIAGLTLVACGVFRRRRVADVVMAGSSKVEAPPA